MCVYETSPHPLPGHPFTIAPAPAPAQMAAPASVPGCSTANVTPSLSPGSTVASAPSDQASMDMESMRLRIQELEERLSQASTPTSSAPSVTSSSNLNLPWRSRDQMTSTLGGTFDVVQESRLFGQAQAVVRSVAHKNRIFGQLSLIHI